MSIKFNFTNIETNRVRPVGYKYPVGLTRGLHPTNITIVGSPLLIAVGHGGGGADGGPRDGSPQPTSGKNGGSGGGGEGFDSANPGGTANQISYFGLTGFGNPGGAGSYGGGPGGSTSPGGAGGAGGAGFPGATPGLNQGRGGTGRFYSISGANVGYAGGGSASPAPWAPPSGGRDDGGGFATGPFPSPGGNGLANRGGGAANGPGFSSPNPAAPPAGTSYTGGSGVVIIRYQTSQDPNSRVSGGTKTTDGDNTVHTFTSSGIFWANTTLTNVDMLIVGGGGGGGAGNDSGPGASGAGGLLYGTRNLNTASYTIVIGAGGVGTAPPGQGTNGENTTITIANTEPDVQFIIE